MDNARKDLEYLISNVVKYGKLFIESDAGRNWEHLGTGSINSERLPWWATFYTELKNGEFIDFTEKLMAHPVNNYQKGEILNEIKELSYKIKESDPANWNNTPLDKLKTSIATKPEVIDKFRKQFEYLVAHDVIDKYTWNKGVRDDVIAINPVNDDFKAIILEGYFSIIDHYENFEARKIKELEERLRDQEMAIFSHQEIIKNLRTQIETLIKENIELGDENNLVYQLEDDVSEKIHNDLFALILLNEFDLLEPGIYGNSSKGKISVIIYNMLKISKRIKLQPTSIDRYRGILLNPSTSPSVYKGWQNIYGKRVSEIINTNIPGREVKINKPLNVK